MPELPDVEVFRHRLASATRHRTIDGVTVHDEQVLAATSAARLRRELAGVRLRRTRRRGKTLYGETAGGPHLRLHFGMTGDLREHTADQPEPEHVRVRFRLSGRHELLFVDQRRFGEVGLVADVDADIDDHDLGPDALDLDVAALGAVLGARRGGLKAVLVDQSRIAGLGNIYADEILFQARLDPRMAAADVDRNGVRRLHRQLHRVIDRAVSAQARPEKMPRGWLVHRRVEDAPCPRGNGTIEAFSVGGRRGFWCPACQRASG